MGAWLTRAVRTGDRRCAPGRTTLHLGDVGKLGFGSTPWTLPSLTITLEAENLAAEFLRTGGLPAAARSDAVHLAVASAARADYLLTWNCRHLANAQILRRLAREAIRYGWVLPTVCTPLELMGDSQYEIESDS